MLELFQNAGWVAWPLGMCSVLALAIVLERFYTLARIQDLEAQAFQAIQKALQERDAAAMSSAVAAAPVTQIIEPMAAVPGASEDAVERIAEVAIAAQRLRLRRYLGTLATIASTAPFIGLFGTVIGVMVAFRGMSTSGLSGEVMAAGISEALSATALGLLVAIPSVIAYNYFGGRVQALLLKIQGDVARLTPLLPTTEKAEA
jgi:biopolymer transport protein ExbB